MVKFNLRKMFAVGLLSATAAFAGATAMQGMPSMVAYAEEAETSPSAAKETATVSYDSALVITPKSLDGNYISVDYYTDEECKKLKSTFTYTKAEVTANGGKIYLNLNLKKGGTFKVYDEKTGVNEVQAVSVGEQADKIKVKVDISQTDLFKALEISIGGGSALTATTAADLDITVSGPGINEAELLNEGVANSDLLTKIKAAARAGGATLIVSNPGENGAMGTEAKVKIPAAPKAPKVVFDYVYGTYTIPAKARYYVTTDSSKTPATDADWKTAEKKVVLRVNEILDLVKTAEATPTSAYLLVETKADKKKMNSITVVNVKALTAITLGEAKDNKADIKNGDAVVATVTFDDGKITIDAKVGMAYYDAEKKKFVKVPKKPITLANNADLECIVVGEKAKGNADAKEPVTVKITNKYAKPAENDNSEGNK